MSDRTPEHRHAVAELLKAHNERIANTATAVFAAAADTLREHGIIPADPSNPETRQTPSPVSYVEEGEKTAPRTSQPVETADPAPTSCPSCVGLGDVPCDHHTRPASERPNAGPESTLPDALRHAVETADGVAIAAVRHMQAETARADAAEAKLRFANDRIKGLETSTAEAWLNHGVALSERKAAEAKLAELQRSYDRSLIARRDLRRKAIAEQAGKVCAERERDEARAKLAELDKGIRDALHGLESDLGDDATLPARVDELHESYLDATRAGSAYLAEREKAVGKLNQVRAAVEEWGPGLYDRLVALIEPVTDREEPCDCLPFDFCPKCCTPESQEETRIRQLAYCEASVQASADPEDGEQCRELRQHGSVYCKAHGGGPAWDHEEPAQDIWCRSESCQFRNWRSGTVPTHERGIGCPPPEASGEPAGETKPRTLLGWTVPDHIAFTIDGGSYVHITCRWALEDDCSTTTAKGNLAWIEQFLRAHAHGQLVERQADSEAQR